jgi:hypothetical protein
LNFQHAARNCATAIARATRRAGGGFMNRDRRFARSARTKQNAFHPIARDLRRKLRRIRSGGGEDAQWLADMSHACPELEDRATELASSMGEIEYFDTPCGRCCSGRGAEVG